MKHTHFPEVSSTQKAIRPLLHEDKYVLVTADQQTEGRGRHGNQWITMPNALTFSMSFSLSDIATLTSLEVGVLICHFFKDSNLKLKWPNDLLTPDLKKCCGVLIENIGNGHSVLGIGVNLGPFPGSWEEFKTIPGSVYNRDFEKEELKEKAKELAQFLWDNRLSPQEIVSDWNKLCAHLNSPVTIKDDQIETKGEFQGIGESGQARIDGKDYYSGSLFID